MFRKIIKLLLIVLWMTFIFSLSNDNGVKSTKRSDGFIVRIVETFSHKKLNDIEKEEIISKYVFITRKCAHLFIYFILGLLIISFLYELGSVNYKSILIALLVSLLYACSDEIHQLFISGRSGKILDIIIDSIGSFIGIMIYYFFYKIRRCLYEQKETIC